MFNNIEKLPQNIQILKNQINDKLMKKVYSFFDFSYYKGNCFSNDDSTNSFDLKLKEIIFDFFQEDLFITLDIYNLDQTSKSKSNIKNFVICGEKKCFLLESIKENIINDFINQKNAIIININDDNLSYDIKTEIQSFTEKYSTIIENNVFIQMTIRPIICYLIRRYFFPTSYFKDKSFFFFNKKPNSNEHKFKDAIEKILYSSYIDLLYAPEMIENLFIYMKETKNEEEKNEILEFNEDDFIILRNDISTKSFSSNNLVMHIDSLYIFVMKKYQITNEECFHFLNHEVEFCMNYSHRCLTKCYGFIKSRNNQIESIIYEFLSNKSLNDEKSISKINEINAITIINRLFQIIWYLQSKQLVFQDIKPSNILFDHDFIPYLNDFEAVRKAGNDDITLDVSTPEYSSPEQNSSKNGKISFPTDIYSFGKIVYFIKEKIHSMISESFNNLSQICVKDDQNERADLSQIQNYINAILFRFYFGDKFIIQLIRNNKQNMEFILMFFENIIFQLFYQKNKNIEFMMNHILFFIVYNISENKNIPTILQRIGIMCLFPNNGNKNYRFSKTFLKMACRQNDIVSCEKLGDLYLYGNEWKRNYEKSTKYYEMAARLGSIKGILVNSLRSMLGLGTKFEFRKGVEFLENFDFGRNDSIYYLLGIIYLKGILVEKNYNKAHKYLEKAANLNNSNALLNLGSMYQSGIGVQRDDEKAKEYFLKSVNQNNIIAIYNLALMYENGYFFPKCIQLAGDYYEKAARSGINCAYLRLGFLHYNGNGIGKNYTKAKEFFEKAAEFHNPEAYIALGQLYFEGNGVEQNYQKAKDYYFKAVCEGYYEGAYRLGIMYYKGLGVEKDYKESFKWFKIASDDYPNAFFYLALQYESNKGIEYNRGIKNNMKDAIINYQKCTKYQDFRVTIRCSYENMIDDSSGLKFLNENLKVFHSIFSDYQIPNMLKKYDSVYNEEIKKYNENYYQSINNLGLCYISYLQDFDTAYEYIKQAGKSIFHIGQNNLGLMYQYIKGDIKNAEYYYDKAAQNHLAIAEYNYGKLFEQINIEKSIEHYLNASKFDEEPIIFKDKVIDYDEDLNISQAFIICLTNFKLANYYLSLIQDNQSMENIEKVKKYLIKSLTNPLFMLLDKLNQNSIEFKIINYINFKDFVLNCPLFSIEHNLDESNWIFIKNNVEEISINYNYCDDTTIKSFNSKEKQKKYSIIRISKYSKHDSVKSFFNELIEIMLQDKDRIKIEIEEIIKEMSQILHSYPYLILFGRMKINNFNDNSKEQDINEQFYDGFLN